MPNGTKKVLPTREIPLQDLGIEVPDPQSGDMEGWMDRVTHAILRLFQSESTEKRWFDWDFDPLRKVFTVVILAVDGKKL